jgi:hypothetical protein
MGSTYEMIEKLDTYKAGLATPPNYEGQSAKFLAGVRLFDHYVNYFTQLKQGK